MRNSSLGHSDPQISASVQSSSVRFRVCCIFWILFDFFSFVFSTAERKMKDLLYFSRLGVPLVQISLSQKSFLHISYIQRKYMQIVYNFQRKDGNHLSYSSASSLRCRRSLNASVSPILARKCRSPNRSIPFPFCHLKTNPVTVPLRFVFFNL